MADIPRLDVLVVGSGVAGLSAAVRLAGRQDWHVGVLTKADLAQSTTRWAQGGVAAVLSSDEDSTDLHVADTLAAGAGLCDVEAVRILVDEGPDRVYELISLGATFDRLPGGRFELAREGGHSTARVLHARGAATGAEIERALVEAVRSSAAALLEGWFAVDLIIEGGRCRGVMASGPDGARTEVRAEHVILSTGGQGQLFAVTTNPAEATGDGVAMALRAGVPVADVEFVQFHPTALHHPAMPRPLLSEALRGHGAVIRDASGDRFVDELAPRDVVSRAIANKITEEGSDHVWLDATGLDHFDRRFPTLASSLADAGLDAARDWLPIAPAAHYVSGGVVTDCDGATFLPGLWAAGEVACTGVHGANRLASNSLLEGMVFAARLSDAIAAGREGPSASGAMRALVAGPSEGTSDLDKIGSCHLEAGGGSPVIGELGQIVGGESADRLGREQVPASRGRSGGKEIPGKEIAEDRLSLQRAMTSGAGVLRSAASLEESASELIRCTAGFMAREPEPGCEHAWYELRNLATAATAVLGAAWRREETRGAHARVDHPDIDPRWLCRIVQRKVPGAEG